MRVAKWGNSLAVRLPKALVEKMGLKEGDSVEVMEDEGKLKMQKDEERAALWSRFDRLSTPLPPGYAFDRDEANAR